MEKETKRTIRNISLRTLLFAFLFLVSLAFFAILAHEVVGENEDWFDTRAFTFLKRYSTPAVIEFFKLLTFFGSVPFLLCAYPVLIIYLLAKRRKGDAINVGIIAITSTALMLGLKFFFQRNRPPLPLFNALNSFSFPSGHALSSFILAGVLIFLIRKTQWSQFWKWVAAILLILLSLLIGISRIVLRYHYASDVVAGFCLGFAWVIFSFYLQRRLKIGSR
jgi:membrane-associated phospholipid phosphatase